LETLSRINQTLEEMGIKQHPWEVRHPVMDQLEAPDFIMAMSANLFSTTDRAMRDLAMRT